jgi:hypothetical protein
MSRKINPVQQLVQEAIDKCTPLTVSEIRALREKSKQASAIFKSIFWVGIVFFNLVLWAPLPIEINKMFAFAILVVSLVVSIIGLRKHQVVLEHLKVNKETLKKKTASEAGRAYIDKVKNQERPFVNIEFELLDGSKWDTKKE